MPDIKITATSSALTINGQSWSSAPATELVCQAINSHDLVDGAPMLFDGKPGAKFRYFETLGLSILESIPEPITLRVTLFMETPPGKRKSISSRDATDASQRPTQKPFSGMLELNGKQLYSPLRFTQFPLKGDLPFVHRIAVGSGLSAHVAVKLGFVENVSFDFERGRP